MKVTNKHNLPDYIYKHICKSYPPKENRYSVTDLINPPLIRDLKAKYWNALTEDASERLWMFFGQMAHAAMEGTADDNDLSEEKLVIPFGGVDVVAKFDRLSNGELIDFKTTSVWSFVYGDKPEWENQMNIYAWALKKTGFDVKKIYIDALLKDWSKTRTKDPDYPRIPFQRVEIPLWTFEQQEAYLLHRLDEHRKVPVPDCTKEEMWEKDDTFAVKKEGRKSALRVLPTRDDAERYITELKESDQKKCSIEHRKGERVRCKNYCVVSSVCPKFKEIQNETIRSAG